MHTTPPTTKFTLNFALPPPSLPLTLPSLPTSHPKTPLQPQETHSQATTQSPEARDPSSRKTSPTFISPFRCKEPCADRFIPVRSDMTTRQLRYDTTDEPIFSPYHKFTAVEEQRRLKYQSLLEGQVLGVPKHSVLMSRKLRSQDDICYSGPSGSRGEMGSKLLRFKTPTKEDSLLGGTGSISAFPFDWNLLEEDHSTPLRKIKSKSYKILDAPQLEDDYYLNLIDWSSSDILAVALQGSVHLWARETGIVRQLCHINDEMNIYTSVGWNNGSEFLATGASNGKLEIWDINKGKIIRNDLESHRGRIGCLAWNSNDILASGSKDRSILVRDLRIKGRESTIVRLKGHRQEICGLKWSPNDYQIASGGNDNKLYVWNMKMGDAEACFSEHKAAVKAITWSPHQSGLLLSGGGNSDQTIKVWNTHTMKLTRSVETGSQVCNMLFSKNSNEIVTTHGFTNNQIIVWNYPDFTKVGVMEGHMSRVLYLALSPDGESIVTGAGANDETLRFWHVFPSVTEKGVSSLMPSCVDLR